MRLYPSGEGEGVPVCVRHPCGRMFKGERGGGHGRIRGSASDHNPRSIVPTKKTSPETDRLWCRCRLQEALPFWEAVHPLPTRSPGPNGGPQHPQGPGCGPCRPCPCWWPWPQPPGRLPGTWRGGRRPPAAWPTHPPGWMWTPQGGTLSWRWQGPEVSVAHSSSRHIRQLHYYPQYPSPRATGSARIGNDGRNSEREWGTTQQPSTFGAQKSRITRSKAWVSHAREVQFSTLWSPFFGSWTRFLAGQNRSVGFF